MERTEAIDKMKGLYGKAAAARKEGKREQARTFTAGASRLKRKIAKMPVPVEAKAEEAEAPAEGGEE